MDTVMAAAPEYVDWPWEQIEPLYAALLERTITPETVDAFLRDWTELSERVGEIGQRLEVGTTQNTADEVLSARYRAYLEEIVPRAREAEHDLTERFLASGIVPEGMEIPARNMRAEVTLFRPENLPLQSEESLLVERYFKITGSQTVEWEGKAVPLVQLQPISEEQDRARRERAWRLAAERRRQDDSAIGDVWRGLLDNRLQQARHAGFGDYRSFRWIQLKRFDYTPDDAKAFDQSVEQVVVPAVARMFERRRRALGLESLRPWDRQVDIHGRPPLRPYDRQEELTQRASTVFHHLDSTLGAYFDIMRREHLLDLFSRENKAPGGYCTAFPAAHRPFIFANANGTRFDVEVVLHEGGHAFHVFERSHLPYHQQRGWENIPMEFAEVGSMAMEFLAEPYLTRDQGGYYTPEDAARARLDHLEQRVLLMWANLAMGDAFQHWIYEHPEDAHDTAALDAVWADLQDRFMPGIDWSGLEEFKGRGWRDTLHYFVAPFYIIEYAFAQLGAVQIWTRAQRDERDAVARYRHALSLGGTRSLPDLFDAAGARFAFDRDTLQAAVDQVDTAIAALQSF